jgi:hypothetical protein
LSCLVFLSCLVYEQDAAERESYRMKYNSGAFRVRVRARFSEAMIAVSARARVRLTSTSDALCR